MTDLYQPNPAVAAARAILLSQRRHRNTKEGKPLTVREAADRFSASKSTVGRHLKSMKLYGKPDFSDNSRGRPRNLGEAEERAVIAYIVWLERAGFPCNQLLIEEAANDLRASRTPPAGPVGDGCQQSDDLDVSQKSKCLSSQPRTVSTTSSTKPRTLWVFSHMPDEEVETRYYNQRTGKEEWFCKHCDKTYASSGGTAAPAKHLMDPPPDGHGLPKGAPRTAKVTTIRTIIEQARVAAEENPRKRRRLNDQSVRLDRT
ncbi:uncharacterized protein FPOAC1_012936 [Fusarium poae]|uniref:uncharacterized protein n=1 Tax=Fusarium poae TaxID=36050 RepID=UPI001D0499D8|nr:uncharacterized protein FPOAC1_012936 [Fusarium poae]KAG8664959.1 hypothetical protein FPOAC1_012936 [Fusarium poae]